LRPRTQQQAWLHDFQGGKAKFAQRHLKPALDAKIGVAGLRIGAGRCNDDQSRDAEGLCGTGKAHDQVQVDLFALLGRSGTAAGRADAAKRVVAMHAVEPRPGFLQGHDPVRKARVVKGQRPARYRINAGVVRRSQQEAQQFVSDQTAATRQQCDSLRLGFLVGHSRILPELNPGGQGAYNPDAMFKRTAAGLLCALMLVTPHIRAGEPAQDERLAVYKQFRSAFDSADYATALPLAVRVVTLTQSQFGAESMEMVNPRTNLATTYYRMGKFGEALDIYRETLALLDQQDDAINPLLIRPLHGIGATLRALDRHPEAIAPLKRAVDITRNSEGLQSPTQLPLLKDLVACYMASGRVQQAGTEQQYAFTVAETTYGRNDIRMLGPLDEYARWNEVAGRYSAARGLHVRAVQLADSVLGAGTIQAVNGLRGIARSYRLAYVNGETEEAAAAETTTSTGMLVPPPVVIAQTQSVEGERALRVAVQRLAAALPAQPQRLGEVQTDLGDWYLTGGSVTRAIPIYEEAYRSLSAADGQKLLATPVPLTYRAPPIAVSRGLQDADLYEEQVVEVRVTIAPNGEVRDAQVANPVAGRESAEKAVVSAVKRATFRPAFMDGVAVTSTDYVFREEVFVKRPKG